MSLSTTPGLINPKQSRILLVGNNCYSNNSSNSPTTGSRTRGKTVREQSLYSKYYYTSPPQQDDNQEEEQTNNNNNQQRTNFSIKRRLLSSYDSNTGNLNSYNNNNKLKYQHYYVLPVLLFEFTALALTRAVLPTILLQHFQNKVYIIMGLTDFIRGLLAFIACPMFGKLSDLFGRRLCLLITVFGTCAPVCSLAFFSWDVISTTTVSTSLSTATTAAVDDGGGNDPGYTISYDATTTSSSNSTNTNTDSWTFDIGSIVSGNGNNSTNVAPTNPYAIVIFIVLLSLSGIFSSTFTLVFAYISDTVTIQEERVSAYGLALATFGLSFTIGPMVGGYLAHTNPQYVFISSLCLTIIDLLYIYIILPESKQQLQQQQPKSKYQSSKGLSNIDDDENNDMMSSAEITSGNSVLSVLSSNDISWNPFDSIQLVLCDPFLRQVGKIAFLYYTGLWAIISTLSVYAVKQFHLTPNRLGELMSALGLSTMIAEAVLVRIIVPLIGEKNSIKIGLVSFSIQCIVLGLAYKSWHLFVCALFSMLGNLVYPSLSSLVSGNVEPEMIGEALGAINGIKALTEGIGPLVFGTLMTFSEHTSIPGWPYLVAAALVLFAYKETDLLPDIDPINIDDEYIHELDCKFQRQEHQKQRRIVQKQQYGPNRYYTTTTAAGVNLSYNRNVPYSTTKNVANTEDEENEVITCVNKVVDVVTATLASNNNSIGGQNSVIRRRLKGKNTNNSNDNDSDNDEEVAALLLSEVDEDDS